MIKAQEIKGRLNGPEILDLMHAAGVDIRKWCSDHEINPSTFYRVLDGQFGERRSAHQTRRIYLLLEEKGFLVEHMQDPEQKAA